MRSILLLSAMALLLSSLGLRADNFTIRQIEVLGVKKISVGTVLNYLPVNIGEEFVESNAPNIIRELHATEFFETIELLRDGDTLIVKVKEKPSIAEISFSGGDAINETMLEQSLEQFGMVKGRIFNELKLSKFELELQRLYYSLGKYSAQVTVDWREVDADRVAISVSILEGESGLIRAINIIGNHAFSEEDLLNQFQLEAYDGGWFTSDQYASSKLIGDLEKLRSFYLDQGYLEFEVDSKQISISPDRAYIDIAINITEGKQYTVKAIDIAGDLVTDKAELMALLLFNPGEVYSHKAVTRTVSLIQRRLGEDGFAFAEIRAIPELDETDSTVNLKLLINPGQKVMVRHIRFSGNTNTRDIVLRREMRQMESELYRSSKIDRSRVRLQRLNFLGSVDLRTVRVAGRDDQVDLEVAVTERFSGNIKLAMKYTESNNITLSLGLTHDNIFGSGNRIGITLDNSAATQRYKLSYFNPFYTVDGVSRGFSLSSSKTDTAKVNISNYLIDRLSVSMHYGIPLSEYNKLGVEFGAVKNDLNLTSDTADEIFDYIIQNSDQYDENTNTSSIRKVTFNGVFGSVSISKDTRNKRIFADTGYYNRIKLEVYAGDLDFYKLLFNHQSAFPVPAGLTLSLRTSINHSSSYGGTAGVPFFEKFVAGGIRSVRGFVANSLGPKDSKNDPLGGNLGLTIVSELLIPVESVASPETFRIGLYWDAGNVFTGQTVFKASDLRQSVGISAKWFSVIGPLEFSYAFPLNDRPGDDVQRFQFALGAAF